VRPACRAEAAVLESRIHDLEAELHPDRFPRERQLVMDIRDGAAVDTHQVEVRCEVGVVTVVGRLEVDLPNQALADQGGERVVYRGEAEARQARGEVRVDLPRAGVVMRRPDLLNAAVMSSRERALIIIYIRRSF
jgi:hypothetical protein